MTLSRRDVGLAVAVFFLTAMPGCKQILGLQDRVEVDQDAGATVVKPVNGQCGGLRHINAACAACMDTNCCAEAEACHGSEECDPAFDCSTTCGDDGACRARCNSFFARPASLVNINLCREQNCHAECGVECGGFAYQAPNCSSCIKQTCCSESVQCAASGDCVNLDLCRANCISGSSSCPGECEITFSGGVALHQAFSDCVQNDRCSEACLPGRNWTCLDARPPWLKPKSAGNITFSLTIVDIVGEAPFAHATVKACGRLDRDCSKPIFASTTDETGFVSLTVPAGSIGFDGYVDMSGGDGSPIFPAIWYPSPNIISSGWRGRIQFVSEDSFKLLASLTTAKIDPMRGHFAANAQDCNFASAPGVTFETDKTDDATTVFYFVGSTPKTNAHETDALTGIGGYINLPADGLTLVTARIRINDEDKVIGSNTYIIRPGTFTTTSIPPTP
jgi:hypothetical protein